MGFSLAQLDKAPYGNVLFAGQCVLTCGQLYLCGALHGALHSAAAWGFALGRLRGDNTAAFCGHEGQMWGLFTAVELPDGVLLHARPDQSVVPGVVCCRGHELD